MPPLHGDDLLGIAYLEPSDFQVRAKVFGVQCIDALTPNEQYAMLATASRLVDTYCGQSFAPDLHTEQHAWNSRTRRVMPRCRPVSEVVEFKIRYATTPAAVVTIAPENVYINNQAGFLEVDSLAAVEGFGILAFVGLGKLTVELQYRGSATIPAAVASATGFIAAQLINAQATNAILPPGLTSMQLGQFQRVSRSTDAVELPPLAKSLLAPFRRIAVG